MKIEIGKEKSLWGSISSHNGIISFSGRHQGLMRSIVGSTSLRTGKHGDELLRVLPLRIKGHIWARRAI